MSSPKISYRAIERDRQSESYVKHVEEIHWLEQIQPSQRTLVGDRALQLSQWRQRGFPVKSGFVVSSLAWRTFLAQFLSSTDGVLDAYVQLNIDDWQQLQQVAQKLRQAIAQESLVVDLSHKIATAAQSWTTLILHPDLVLPEGIPQNLQNALESPVSNNHPAAIAQALLRTWSQLFSARNLFYWRRVGIDLQQLDVALLVQPLHNAIASGILHCQPDRLEIQASYGLGLAIARGEVIPDFYLVDPTGTVRSQTLGYKTIAYGVTNLPVPAGFTHHTSLSNQNDLQVYLLNAAQQQQYVLQHNLQQLIHLGQKFIQETHSAITCEWALETAGIEPHLVITQYRDSPVGLETRPQPLAPSPALLLQGLAAAPGRSIAPAYVVSDPQQTPHLPPGVIVVTTAITPDWLPLLQHAAGFITEHGGLTSHSAILARELGIPAVVSVAKATQILQTNDLIELDGNQGKIHRLRSHQTRSHPMTLLPATNRKTGDRLVSNKPHRQFDKSVTNRTVPIATQILLNLSQLHLLDKVQNLPVDGLGLLRSELMVLNMLEGQSILGWLPQRQPELLELWQEHITQFARAFAPKPVIYRSLDWRSPEFQLLSNPAITTGSGDHSIVSYLQDPTLFDLEITALAGVRQAGYDNIHLLLPFMRTVEEFVFCRQRVEQVGLTQSPQFQLWIMAEVPSVLFLLPEYVAAGVQGVSIGTNDLTQLLLGVNRDFENLATFDARHPVVMRAIAQIIQQAKQARIPCTICGQAPVLYPELIDSLVEWGITAISVEADAVEVTYQAIARAEQRLLLKSARHQLHAKTSKFATEPTAEDLGY
ncbi:putative PEP-binding protein [Chroogloeocystis siderophila]|uniref:putative PEP-binding protein n=1 Tax=Chroogloeocystis siderophila TaxID=329163 RepID=UPI000A018CFC|nr:putative PEP-binding protein [Chroogloeocystis siderophila]